MKLPQIANRTGAAALGLALALAACSPAPAPAAPPVIPVATTAAPDAGASATVAPATSAAPGAYRLDLAPSGNEARYRVREQLARLTFPTDAIGATQSITGSLVINPDGTLVAEQSKFLVDLTTLRSDSSMRDGFISRNTLQSSQFPQAVFVPRTLTGLPTPLPTTGPVTFQLIGDLTVHGVTKSVTWEVTAQAQDGTELTGTATTTFQFGDFGMTPPRAGAVLSVEDKITLELDFHLIGTPAA
jgi:polyisoprenoid-binding protein YceI